MNKAKSTLEFVAILSGAITFGTAYYLLFLAHPAWSTVPFEAFLPVFRASIMQVGLSQFIISNIALVSSIILFFWGRDRFWLLAVAFLLVSLPVTVFYMMPINVHFLESSGDALSDGAGDKLASWGRFQIIRFICDGLALACMIKPIIWRNQRT